MFVNCTCITSEDRAYQMVHIDTIFSIWICLICRLMMVNNPLIFVGVAKAEKAIEWDTNSAIAHKW